MEEENCELIASINVDENQVELKNYTRRIELLVNGKCQDIYGGIPLIGTQRLTGKLTNGKEIKAILCSEMKLRCYVFIDNELVFNN